MTITKSAALHRAESDYIQGQERKRTSALRKMATAMRENRSRVQANQSASGSELDDLVEQLEELLAAATK